MTTLNAPDSNYGSSHRPDVRAQTLQQKFGFQDAELATEQHDAIVLWLDSAVPSIMAQFVTMPPPWRIDTGRALEVFETYKTACMQRWQKRIDEVSTWHGNRYDLQELEGLNAQLTAIMAWTLPVVPVGPKLSVQEKRWEYAISTGRGFVVGFVDMRVSFEAEQRVHLELPIRSDDYFSHLNESTARPQWDVEQRRGHISFEVKGYIKSAGEIIRQIRLYQEYLKDQFVVVSPDTRFAEILREQGIGFVEYPG